MASSSAEPRLGGSRGKGPSSSPHKFVDRQASKSGQQSRPVGGSSVAGDGSRCGPISWPLWEGRSWGRSLVRAPTRRAPSKPASSSRPP